MSAILLTIFGSVVVLVVGLRLMLAVVTFITSLREKRPLKYLVLADADDPEHSKLPWSIARREPGTTSPTEFNPYEAPSSSADHASTTNAEAARLGFTFCGLYRHAKGGTYKSYNTLWLSPSRDTLAVVVWGTLARIDVSKTVLYSAFDDGRYLISASKFTGTETPGLYELAYFLGADFAYLLRRHDERLAASGRRVRPFPAGDGLAALEAIVARRSHFLVESGDAYFVDPEGSVISSTFKGASKLVLGSFRVPKNVERMDQPGKPLVWKAPPALAWAERLCFLTIFLGLWMNSRSPAKSPAQGLFRASLFLGSLVGLVVIGITKSILKRRAA